MSYTGYWIADKGQIYGPHGFTGHWIEDGHIFGPNGYTYYWIEDHHIFSSDGYTQCWIVETGQIYGPKERLPWCE
jgi:hypothetical protein